MNVLIPRVSIITLTYKNYSKLFSTISSILNQDFPAFEYIISDDGSGDFPEDEVREFIENNKKSNLLEYKLIINKENVGTVKHINNVIKICKGDYIFDLSGNDVFINNHVVTNIMSEFEREDCDVLIVSRISYYKGKVYQICPHYLDWKNIYKLDTPIKRYEAMMRTEHFGMFIGPNIFYKREVIERNGFFDENYKLLEDAPMIAKMLWNESVSIRPDIFAVLYDNESGVSAKGSRNIDLLEDIRKFNAIGKLDHYWELDYKTRYHIDFGIKRSNARNSVELFFVCLLYLPRVLSMINYLMLRKIKSIGDKAFIKKSQILIEK